MSLARLGCVGTLEVQAQGKKTFLPWPSLDRSLRADLTLKHGALHMHGLRSRRKLLGMWMTQWGGECFWYDDFGRWRELFWEKKSPLVPDGFASIDLTFEVCILENRPDPSSSRTRSSHQDWSQGGLWVFFLNLCESLRPATVLCWKMLPLGNSNRILEHPAFDAFFAFIVTWSNRRKMVVTGSSTTSRRK